jgi:hypothetical protein
VPSGYAASSDRRDVNLEHPNAPAMEYPKVRNLFGIKVKECWPCTQCEGGWGNRGITPDFLKLGSRCGLMINLTSWPLHARGKNTHCSFKRRLSGSQSLSVHFSGLWRELNHDSSVVEPVLLPVCTLATSYSHAQALRYSVNGRVSNPCMSKLTPSWNIWQLQYVVIPTKKANI